MIRLTVEETNLLSIKGFFLRLEGFIFRLQRGKVRELCNARRFQRPCGGFM